ncbi:acyl carrier protein [Brevibacillus formosus]|uniref:acyl carrier protein n=1 Tax=Brevibacillus TaxID=55080 RepID=UPI000D0EC8EC|nr:MULTISPECIES: acyl carrier protein [Bacillales]MBG9945204.1 poly(3-hydroxyalkanoate) depolymerase [Brevibacillus formosus]MBW5467440.1 acyl carrier protein [Brevibacillus formosus]MED1943551.1 acyl carrier protein [Brevibacillus formosus]MED2000077.1 acyl carrier protein [Brevibacillus formosus]MED2081786.1 acyl carrier protein [Brevibacillus formosus]
MNRQEITALIIKNLYEIVPELEGRELRPEDRLSDLGLNSIDRADLISMVMEDLSLLQNQRSQFIGLSSIGELADGFLGKL